MSACADTKYKSVFVMSEEKDECIIATEVSSTLLTLSQRYDFCGHLEFKKTKTKIFCLFGVFPQV